MALNKADFIKVLDKRRKHYRLFKNIFFYLLLAGGGLLLYKQSKGIEIDAQIECFALAMNYFFVWRMAKAEEIAEDWIVRAKLVDKETLTYDDVTLQRK